MSTKNSDSVIVPRKMIEDLEWALAELVYAWDKEPGIYEQAEPLGVLKGVHNELIGILGLDGDPACLPTNGHRIACLHSARR